MAWRFSKFVGSGWSVMGGVNIDLMNCLMICLIFLLTYVLWRRYSSSSGRLIFEANTKRMFKYGLLSFWLSSNCSFNFSTQNGNLDKISITITFWTGSYRLIAVMISLLLSSNTLIASSIILICIFECEWQYNWIIPSTKALSAFMFI